MDLSEVENEVDGLETRIERLRALYEQYFMGLEKMEPGTVRAELDRKLWQLRKKRIQNTGLRYRLQMLIQRYNTYQQYWQRVTREIERGTYMRDVLRVAKRIGSHEAMTILGQRRAKMFKNLANAQEARKLRRGGEAVPADAASNESSNELSDEATVDRELAADSSAEAATDRPPDARPRATQQATGSGGGSGSNFEDPTTWNLFEDGSSPGGKLDALPPSAPPTEEEEDLPTLPPPSMPMAAGPAPRISVPPSARLPASAPAPEPSSPPAGTGRRPIPPPRAAVLPPRPAPATAESDPPGSDARLRQVYEQYVQAKRRSNEPTEGLTFDKLRRSLDRQAEQLRSRHGNREIEFEVITQDGRTRIRPVVR